MSKIPSRDEAFELFLKYNKSDSLINHGKAVESVMRFAAEKLAEDSEKWAIIGLVHDLDYEMFPDQHCEKTEEILKENDWDQEYIRAVISHGWGCVNDIKPESLMEKYLYAVDELCGLVTAAALVRPSKSVVDLTVKSVKKKWKVKSFAAGANREIIMKGAELLGITIEELIQLVIDGMKSNHEELGL